MENNLSFFKRVSTYVVPGIIGITATLSWYFTDSYHNEIKEKQSNTINKLEEKLNEENKRIVEWINKNSLLKEKYGKELSKLELSLKDDYTKREETQSLTHNKEKRRLNLNYKKQTFKLEKGLREDYEEKINKSKLSHTTKINKLKEGYERKLTGQNTQIRKLTTKNTNLSNENYERKKRMSDTIEYWNLPKNPWLILELNVSKGSHLWGETKLNLEEVWKIKIDDQLLPDKSSSQWGIYLNNKIFGEIAKNFPPQPKTSQKLLRNLNLIPPESRFRLYHGDR